MITKGAAEEVMERCTMMYDPAPCNGDATPGSETATGGAVSTSHPIDEVMRRSLTLTAETLNAQGLRVIAVAIKPFTGLPSDATLEKDVEVVFEECDLVFVGFLAFLDPPKPDAADAIDRLKGLGVKVSLTFIYLSLSSST